MDLISVIGTVECTGAEVESDPWIPLKISWWPRGPRQPLYLRVSGANGGEVELKVDPDNGALIQMIIITQPLVVTVARGESAEQRRIAERTVVLDRSRWAEDGSIVKNVQDLVLVRDQGAAELRFADAEVVSRVWCGDVVVGLSAESSLISIGAVSPALDG
ncbi:hypothetical protein [Nocardioides luteus]|uniref:hypothetical protein n=1 Tax=Nocardioides luteus TaxID=1844 RepID=UPI0018CB32CB|nr:hypothetical protein [Nocardioides luteus]MBG6099515.1 hypothetical protein [Nocardioides luteus]